MLLIIKNCIHPLNFLKIENDVEKVYQWQGGQI